MPKTFLLGLLLGPIILYGCFVFVTLDPFIFDWHEFGRLLFLILCPLVSVGIGLLFYGGFDD